MRPKLTFIVLTFLLLAIFVNGQQFRSDNFDKVYYINYGPDAIISEGDDDYFSIYYIKIPCHIEETLYLKIFDMDCGRDFDQQMGNWNTSTQYSLYAGDFSTEFVNVWSRDFENSYMHEGTLIAEKTVGWTAPLSNYWYPFAALNVKDGKQIGDYYIFKLVIQTTFGDDGNVYDLFVSSDRETNEIVEGVDIYSLKTTFRLSNDRMLNHFAFSLPPESNELNLYNFDNDGVRFTFSTHFREGIPLASSKQGQWKQNRIKLNKYEVGTFSHVEFFNSGNRRNDITMYVLDEYHQPIPISKTLQKIHANNDPTIVFDYDYIDDCGTVTFDGSRSYDREETKLYYKWYLDDNPVSNSSGFTYEFPSAGTYDMALVVLDDIDRYCCGSYKEFKVTINDRPVAHAGNDIQSEPFKKILFSGVESYDIGGKIKSYHWNFGDGDFKYGSKVNHLYSNSGKYNVVLTVTDNSNTPCNFSTDTLIVWINSPPVADAGPDIAVVPNQSFTLSGSNSIDPDGTISKYEWHINREVYHGENIDIVIPEPGIYKAMLKTFDNSGDESKFDVDDVKIIVNAPPIPKVITKTVIAPNEEITFDASKSYDSDGKISKYDWVIEGEKHTGAIVKTKFNNPGYYPVVLQIKDDHNLKNSITLDTTFVRVNSSPIPQIIYEKFACGSIQTFDASSSIDSDGDNLKFTWNFGKDFPTKNGAVVTNNFVNPGKYIITLKVDDQRNTKNSVTEKTVPLVINAPPIADAGPDEIACIGKPLFFTGATSIDFEEGTLKFYWDFDDGTNSEGINVTKTYHETGLYEVKLKIEDNSGLECDFDFDTKLVRIVEAPIAFAGPDQIVCLNEVVEFDGSRSVDEDGIVNKFTWDFGDGTTSGGGTARHIYNTIGNYTVTLEIEGEYNDACSNSSVDELIVSVIDAPIASIESVDSVTLGSSSYFLGKIRSGSDFVIEKSIWLVDEDTTYFANNLNHTFNSAGIHQIKYVAITNAPGECKTSEFEKSIYVNDSPIADAGEKLKAFVGEPITLDASRSFDSSGKIAKYIWIFEDGTSVEGIKLLHVFKNAGQHKVILKVVDDTSLSNNTSTTTLTVNVSLPHY